MNERPPSWRRAVAAVATTTGVLVSIAGVLMDQAYAKVVAATAFALTVGVLLVLAVRAFSTLLPIYAERARIENDRLRIDLLTRSPESGD